MSLGRLSALQERALLVLSEFEPTWTLTGGAALAGFHTQHRETRDLDLFWQNRHTLDDLVDNVVRRLRRAGLEVAVLQREESFGRVDVRDSTESIIIDLVADPVTLAEKPQRAKVGDVTIFVDTPHQILVNKLCALLSRSELRDLEDVKMLLESGGDLPRALSDCPKQDGGFSPLTFSWATKGLEIERLAAAAGWSKHRIKQLEQFRNELVEQVIVVAKPD